MTSSGSSAPTSTSVLRELYLGRVRWDLLRPFPDQETGDRGAGDVVIAELRGLLHEWIDPEAVDGEGRLPDGFTDALQEAGLLRLMVEPSLGGRGLSWLNACRVVEAAAGWSMPVAFTLAIQNGFGSGSYLPALPPGPLHDLISHRVAGGIVSAAADAEAAGTANQSRTTVAVPVENGAAYLVTGEKCFIGNGPIADFLDVSATVIAADGTESVRLFFLDTGSPGFEVVGTHQFMGLRGAAIGVLRLDAVRVPAEQMLPELSDGWRMRPTAPRSVDGTGTPPGDLLDLGQLATLARHLVIAPPSLAVARMSLRWARDFAGRRTIDGRGLGSYEEIQRQVAENAAEVYAAETILRWCVLGTDRADTHLDLTPAKNLASRAAERAIDRTMALLGAEGYETARSKTARGAEPLPVERCFRDARALRVAGGVDFMLDLWSAKANLSAWYDQAGRPGTTPPPVDAESFPPRCLPHARFVTEQAERLAQICRRLTGDTPLEALFERQRTIKLIGQIATELLGIAVAVARSADLADQDEPMTPALADLACTAARHRLTALWSQLTEETTPRTGTDPATTGAALLDATGGTGGTGETEPPDTTEATVAAIWCELFGLETIDPRVDFYELGGHSLLAIRMTARIRDVLGLKIPVRMVLENPTVAELAEAVGARSGTS
ncbi:phosphopantetheine-binding protein [Streptomyces sp. NPDC091292]|uniref:phosphopantetheine-binding protein n=1 Tax=Streptomyces sp. NPDC091292 TaxID=3365991 RepID=UPI00380FA1AE